MRSLTYPLTYPMPRTCFIILPNNLLKFRLNRSGQKTMIKWFIDKESKVPLYLQLKELIRYYISTGAIESNQRMPTVKNLAKQLEINFETIRKAYKELEKEGLVTTKRGRGTFAINHSNLVGQTNSQSTLELRPLNALKDPLKRLLQRGFPLEEVRIMIDQALNEVSYEASGQLVVFTECNVSQIDEISTLLRSYLNVNVEPLLLRDLRKGIERISKGNGELLAVITTGFHMKEVRNSLMGLPVRIDFLITNMSLETRQALAALDKTVRYGFVCRDQESISFYKDMLQEELGLNSPIECCILEAEAKLRSLFESVDILLVSPPVYEDIRRLAPSDLRIFNVFGRVDPMSLMVIKERLLGGN